MPSVKDYKDILATVQLYVDGCNEGDPAIMEPAFDKQAVMFSYDENGKMVAEGSITHLFDGLKGIGKETNSVWQIDVLDATPTTAVVRVMAEKWHGVGFIDHHSLVKTGKGWKIVAKIYHSL